ncbi:ATP-binding cassette domain-containing protein [Paenibacillus sp. sptzw28]|uniref:ABC transporter ATP-binding protein n=1 Tax=Paenibacillus sp. sptzw28 TaxID=715179 RepID=UPI001C6F5C70|nr:ATP-binding cassette domain-containing protein [Paenibacillus sp. sptzw28]QYR21109.1 ATP-binding cassette domain-containing protein [Paenibacillus sp. sptzw28]
MNRINKVIGMMADSFIKIYRISPLTVILMVTVTIVGAFYSYVNIYFSKIILDSIVEMNESVIIWGLCLFVGFQLLKLIIDFFSSLQIVKMSINFSKKSDEEMIDQNAKMELLIKEFPSFQSEFAYLKFANNKIYENYLNLIEFITQLIVLMSLIKYLSETFILFSILAMAVGVLKGIINLTTVKKRVKLNAEIESSLMKPMYYYNLLTGVDTQKEITLYSTTNYYKQKWKEELDKIDFKKVCLEKMEKITYASKEILTIVNSAVVVVLLVYLIKKQQASVGDYIAVTMAVTIIINVISSLIEGCIKWFENLQYSEMANDMRAIIAEKSVVKTTYDKLPFSFQNSINLSNLNFTYPNSQNVALSEINLSINKGETIAVLGENGSGKTTLVKLLLGLYKVEDNCIFYDNVPINKFDVNSLYQKTSAIFQDYIKYQTNVRENVAVGDISQIKDDGKLESILKRVVFDKDLPHGLNTKLGFIDQESINLSGGQWQRLALARVFVKDNPEIIIFDEPTSAMDPLAEMRILNDVLEYCKTTTTIMISHRVGIARKADKICVMQKGKIVEFGTHDELMFNKHIYYDMWMSQREWYNDTKVEVLAP